MTRPGVASVLGDGAPWIWNLADEQFPGAIQIVDLYHTKGHLWDVAKAIYGAGTDLAEQWAKQRRDELDEGKLAAVLAALRVHAAANDEARKCLDYIIRHRHRMRYPKFRAQGLCTSHWRGRGRLQDGDRDPLQARRHALDRRRGRRDHRAALLQAEQPLRGLLGAAIRSGARRSLGRPVRSSHKSDVRPCWNLLVKDSRVVEATSAEDAGSGQPVTGHVALGADLSDARSRRHSVSSIAHAAPDRPRTQGSCRHVVTRSCPAVSIRDAGPRFHRPVEIPTRPASLPADEKAPACNSQGQVLASWPHSASSATERQDGIAS